MIRSRIFDSRFSTSSGGRNFWRRSCTRERVVFGSEAGFGGKSDEEDWADEASVAIDDCELGPARRGLKAQVKLEQETKAGIGYAVVICNSSPYTSY